MNMRLPKSLLLMLAFVFDFFHCDFSIATLLWRRVMKVG